tara:strand:- start:1692 stop:1931 length:240 start_codon:yes stop_codon:yes gene_type:complete
MARKLSEIAQEIRTDWKKVSYAAEPYLNAMEPLKDLDDNNGGSEVLYFLLNASSWRGEVAQRIKDELRLMLYEDIFPDD